jgi:hypothetical protein
VYTGSSDRECKRLFGAEAFIFYPRPLCRFDKANNRGNQSFSGLHAQHPAEPLDDGKEAAVDRPFFASRQSHTLLCRRLATPGVNQVLVEATPRI